MRELPPALIVAGPTASGKSALALDLAEALGGSIINADSMQLYAELRVLTARPTPAEESRVPHLLYGALPAAQAGSVAWWRRAALAAMEQVRAAGRLPILCGGTGLYFAALREGLSDMPEPGEAARTQARQLLAELGPAALHARLAEVDPQTASRLRPTDAQRLARAWEIWLGTGTGLAAWQAQRRGTPAPWNFTAIILDPPREALRLAIASRFATMLEQGALAEVQALLAQELPHSLPAMRAHGVPELSACLRGEITLAEAGRRTQLVTGQYTKRQATWLRHHVLADPAGTHTIYSRYADPEQFSQRNMGDLISFIRGRVDAAQNRA